MNVFFHGIQLNSLQCPLPSPPPSSHSLPFALSIHLTLSHSQSYLFLENRHIEGLVYSCTHVTSIPESTACPSPFVILPTSFPDHIPPSGGMHYIESLLQNNDYLLEQIPSSLKLLKLCHFKLSLGLGILEIAQKNLRHHHFKRGLKSLYFWILQGNVEGQEHFQRVVGMMK